MLGKNSEFKVQIDRLVSIFLLKIAKQLVSVTVVCNSRCLVPWAVIPAEATDRFSDLLDSMKAGKYGTIQPDVLLDQAERIETVLVGKEKMSLSVADKDMNIIEVCQSFGPFIKPSVVKEQHTQPPVPAANTFEILMASQRRLSLPCLPERISERTKKDKLFNDLISLLESMGKK